MEDELERKVPLNRRKPPSNEELPTIPTLQPISGKQSKPSKKGKGKKNSNLTKKALSRKYAENRKEKQIRDAAKVLATVDIQVGSNRPLQQIVKTAQTFVSQEQERLSTLKRDLQSLLAQKPDVDVRIANPTKNGPQTYEQKLADFASRLKSMEAKITNINQTVNAEVKRCESLSNQLELLKQRDIATRFQVRNAAQRLFDDPESYARFHGGPGIIDGTKI